MDKIIRVKTKTHFGTEHIYVVSGHKRWIEELTGRITVTANDLHALKNLGFEVERVYDLSPWEVA